MALKAMCKYSTLLTLLVLLQSYTWMILPYYGSHIHFYASLLMRLMIQCHIVKSLLYPLLFPVCPAYCWIPQWYLCIVPLFAQWVSGQLLVTFWMNGCPGTAPFAQCISLILELTLGQFSVLVWSYQICLMLVYTSKNLKTFSVILQLQILVTNIWLVIQDILCSW